MSTYGITPFRPQNGTMPVPGKACQTQMKRIDPNDPGRRMTTSEVRNKLVEDYWNKGRFTEEITVKPGDETLVTAQRNGLVGSQARKPRAWRPPSAVEAELNKERSRRTNIAFGHHNVFGSNDDD